jgi:hypothetical protein
MYLNSIGFFTVGVEYGFSFSKLILCEASREIVIYELELEFMANYVMYAE